MKGQTGEGHFQPVGGLNMSENKALMLDVARFKYPPYWCSLPLLYDSLMNLDNVTKKPRGFALISRDLDNFSNTCSITPDEVSRKNVQSKLHSEQFMSQYKSLDNNFQLSEFFGQFFKQLGFDFCVLLVYNMYEVVDYFDKQGEQTDYLFSSFQKNKVYKLSEKILQDLHTENHELGILIEEFCGKYASFVLSQAILAIPVDILKKINTSLYNSQIENIMDEYLHSDINEMHDFNLEITEYLKQIVSSFTKNLY